MENISLGFKRSYIHDNTYHKLIHFEEHIKSKRKVKTKLFVCLVYLKYSNQKKRWLKEKVKESPYPEYAEWNKLVDIEKKFAYKILCRAKQLKEGK